MRLSSLYCNLPDLFGPIHFRPGLNVVLGEIRLPDNNKENVHNLGKTTLAKVIDFCLCRGAKKSFFLLQHEDLFRDFVFYIELQLLDGDYLTIRRSVESPTKLSFARHSTPTTGFVDAGESDWDHANLAFVVGKQLLDGILGLTDIKPWDFRKPIGYALRTQSDFSDVFQLAKHKGKHREWKPYVAHILGFDSALVTEIYDNAEKIENLQRKISTLRLELGGDEAELDTIRGLIDIKSKDVAELEAAIQQFDFELQDSKVNKTLVDQLDEGIATLNGKRYQLARTQKRIVNSLNAEQIQFRPSAAKKLFEEAGVLFPDQVKKEFEDLIRFNKEISKERIKYLKEELKVINEEIASVAIRLDELNKKRQSELAFLGNTEAFSKYREMNGKLVELKKDLASLERQRDALLGIGQHEKDLRNLTRKREDLLEDAQTNLEQCSENKSSRYSRIRAALAEICESFIGHKALLTSKVNKEGNFEFQAEYLDTLNRPTSEDEGKSFRQVLCAAYDLAVSTELLKEDFVRFVFHDGLLEGLDNRIKLNIIGELRKLADQGLQQIMTVIDSDLPHTIDGEKFKFDDDEVILVLHDDGPNGRLFRMDSW